MPRLPRPPGHNPPAELSLLLDAFPDWAADREEGWAEVAALLARRGDPAAARALLAKARMGSAARLLAKGWIAHHSPASVPGLRDEVRSDAAQLQQSAHASAMEQVLSACALALAGDAARLDDAIAAIDHGSRALEVCRVLLVLEQPEAALALLDRHALWKQGVGWSTARLHLYGDAFMLSALRWLIRAERWDLLGRYGAGLVATDGVMLGSIALRMALLAEGIAHAPAALAVLPDAFLEACFLGIAAEVPAALHPQLVPLIPHLSGGMQAIAHALLCPQAPPPVADDADWSRRRQAILALARRQPAVFADLTAAVTSDHEICRIVVGGVRCLRMLGASMEDAERDAWLDRLEALARTREAPREQSDLLGELGSALCRAGWRERGTALLEAAVVLADGVPKAGDRGWGRNDALDRACAFCTQAEAWPQALRALQRCTAQTMRENHAGPLAEAFVRAGDMRGAWMILQFAPAGRPQAVASARAILASQPGTLCAGWLPPR